MPSANHLRVQIEAAFANRFPAALTPARAADRECIPSGIDTADRLMHGGIPCSAITEFAGPASSGRTSLALACAAAIIRTGGVCAWVDAGDALCPEDAAANGVDLDYLLWVRCGSSQNWTTRNVSASVAESKPPSVTGTQARNTGGGSPHPRSEANLMPQAISAMLKAHGGLHDSQIRREKRAIGTPGHPNRPVAGPPRVREEQVTSDRLPPRRGDNLALEPRCAEPQPRRVASLPDCKMLQMGPLDAAVHPAGVRSMPASSTPASSKSWQPLDQAVRATDLLLQAGGFRAIVLDLGGVPPEMAWRIPLATWFRYRAACERTRTGLLLLTQHPCARSSAELVLRLNAGSMEANSRTQSRVMTGVRYRAEIERVRSDRAASQVVPIRKPPQREQSCEWVSETSYRTGSGAR